MQVEGIPYFIVGNAGGRFSDLTGGNHSVWYKFGQTRERGYLKGTASVVGHLMLESISFTYNNSWDILH